MRIRSAMLVLTLIVLVGCQDASNPSRAADPAVELIETTVVSDSESGASTDSEASDADAPSNGDASSDTKTTAEAEEKEPEYDLTKIERTEKEWRKQLTRQQFRVTRQHATERPRTGRFWNHKVDGVYVCVCCGLPLFSSETKFVSGTGWPSFYQPIEKKHVGMQADNSFFQRRTEVHCKRCDAHLGHVFDDGPEPTGLRYCINSVSLDFKKGKEAPEKKK